MVSFVEGNSICCYPGDRVTEEILNLHDCVSDPLFTGHKYLIFEVNALWERMMTWQIGRISTFRAYMEEHKRLECYTEDFHFLFGDRGEMIPNSLPPTTSCTVCVRALPTRPTCRTESLRRKIRNQGPAVRNRRVFLLVDA